MTDSYKGTDVCEGEHEVAEWVFSVRVGLGFQLEHCQHFQSFARLCSPPCIGQDGVRPQNRSWRRPSCQNHSDFTTHETCEHDTSPRWKTARRTNSVTARAIWNECSRPHRLILLIRSLSPARFGFPSSQTHFVTHEPSGSKPYKVVLHFWLRLTCRPTYMWWYDRQHKN